MEKNKITFKSINKKLLTGAVVLVLSTTSLTGCYTINDIEHTTNEQGYIQGIDGTVSYDFLSFCDFYKITNKITGDEYYTVVLQNGGSFRDIFTRQELKLSGEQFELVYIDVVENYLNYFNLIKDEYTEEEIREILNKFIETQEKETTKELVKEK